MATMTTGNLARAVAQGILAHIQDGQESYTPIYPQIYNVDNTIHASETYYTYTGVAKPTEVAEAQAIPEDSVYPRYTRTITPRKFAVIIPFSAELELNDQASIVKRIKAARQLGRGMVEAEDEVAASIFNNHTSTSSPYVGGDAKALTASDHPTSGSTSGTRSNLGSSLAMTPTNLWTSVYTMADTLDTRDRYSYHDPAVLLVGRAQEKAAWECLQSGGLPYSSDNTRNFIATQGLKLVVWKYISSTKWFLLSEKDFHYFYFLKRQDGVLKYDYVIENDVTKYMYKSMFDANYADWYGCYGTAGA